MRDNGVILERTDATLELEELYNLRRRKNAAAIQRARRALKKKRTKVTLKVKGTPSPGVVVKTTKLFPVTKSKKRA